METRKYRTHTKWDGRKFVPKKSFNNEKDAVNTARHINSQMYTIHKMVAYKCQECGKWHRNIKHKKEIGTLGLRIIIPEIKLNTKSGLPTARVRQEDARGHCMEPPEVGRSVRRGKRPTGMPVSAGTATVSRSETSIPRAQVRRRGKWGKKYTP